MNLTYSHSTRIDEDTVDVHFDYELSETVSLDVTIEFTCGELTDLICEDYQIQIKLTKEVLAGGDLYKYINSFKGE